MTGLEYILLHVQEPILYVIRKQHRYSPTQATPLADYYIIAGVVYQAPDLASVVNSRLVNLANTITKSFTICFFTFSAHFHHFFISKKCFYYPSVMKNEKLIVFFSSCRLFITCNRLSKRPAVVRDIIRVEGTRGISKMGNPLRRKRKCRRARNRAPCFNANESICFWPR